MPIRTLLQRPYSISGTELAVAQIASKTENSRNLRWMNTITAFLRRSGLSIGGQAPIAHSR
jgi:hypothetical protein